MSTKALTDNQVIIRYHELSDELGYHSNTIAWVHCAIKTLCQRKKKEIGDDQPLQITAEELCAALIKDVNQLYDEPIQKTLCDLKFSSSKDIGRIVFGLVDKTLITASPNDSISDYENIFSVDNLEVYLSEVGIKQRTFSIDGWYQKVMWTFYVIGTVIVVASYCNLVDNHIAWVGWIIAMCGFMMQFVKRPAKKRF